jgi:RND family efflux transporter MFP subunit
MNNIFFQFITWNMAILAVSCSGKTDTPAFETVPAQKRNISTSILATGIVKPKVGAEVKVGSRVSGVVRKLFVKNGDVVHQGDLLALLDDSELSARYRLEMANLENAQTTLKYARIEMERVKSLVDKDFATTQSYDNLVKEYDLAVARLASQQAQVDYASTELGFTKIYAPISGVIGSVSTQEGETVSAAFASPTFVTIIDLSRIEVWAYVDETDIGKVAMGQQADFTVDTYPGIVFRGIVTAIYPKAEIRDNVVNYVVIIEFKDTGDKQLRPEMTSYVTIQTTSTGIVLSVPNNAIKRQNSETVVYVLENGHPVQRKIKTGAKGNQLTEVLEGLNENEQIILNNHEISK